MTEKDGTFTEASGNGVDIEGIDTVDDISQGDDKQIEKAGDDMRDDQSNEALRTSEIGNVPIDGLLSAVESELIPRLMLSHFANSADGAPGPEELTAAFSEHWWNTQSIEQFARWSAAGDTHSMDCIVLSLLKTGVDISSIYLKLISPTAKLLGDQWLEDKVSFVDVHLGLLHLQKLIVDYESFDLPEYTKANRSVLLATAPGEQHTLGVSVVSDMFRRAGWQVTNGSGLNGDEILHEVSLTSYDCVGFSLNYGDCLSSLTELVVKVRQFSVNQDALVVAGGDYFINNPTMQNQMDVDLCIVDGSQAVDLIEKALPYLNVEARLLNRVKAKT